MYNGPIDGSKPDALDRAFEQALTDRDRLDLWAHGIDVDPICDPERRRNFERWMQEQSET